MAKGLLDGGRSSCPAGDSLRSPSWCPGRTTESGARPRLRAAHPKGTGKSLVFCVFFLLEGLVSNQRALAGARNVVARCARQLSQSESSRAAATLLQCAESNRVGIGLELRRPLAPGTARAALKALRAWSPSPGAANLEPRDPRCQCPPRLCASPGCHGPFRVLARPETAAKCAHLLARPRADLSERRQAVPREYLYLEGRQRR